MSSHSRYDDRRHSSSSRRDSSQRRDRDSRRSSPGPSRGRSPPPRPRDENELPVEFGRPLEPTSREDENTVLKRMKTAFEHSPLKVIYESIGSKLKVKIWTRNFKEVRGICTGYVIAFDKHWNMILSDVEEVYLKPKKAKTPYLLDVESSDDVPELPPKTPRVKKTKTPEEEEAARKKAEEEAAAAADKPTKVKKKKGRKINKRHLKQLFVRGDNIVMCAVLEKQAQDKEKEKE